MRRLSLAQRFLIGSLVILLAGMSVIGVWVSRQIEGRVIQRTAATTALEVDSMITNSLQDLATGDAVSEEGAKRLRWLLEDTDMGRQIVNFRVWDAAGRIVFCTDPTQVGMTYPVDDELRRAWDGGVSAAMGQPEGGVVHGAATSCSRSRAPSGAATPTRSSPSQSSTTRRTTCGRSWPPPSAVGPARPSRSPRSTSPSRSRWRPRSPSTASLKRR